MSEDSQNIKKTAIEACRALAWMSASYYSVVLSLFYLLLGYAAQGYLARSVYAAPCFPAESAVFAGILAGLVLLPAGLFWFGKVAQGVAAFVLVPLLAAPAGYVYYLSLLSPSCGWW